MDLSCCTSTSRNSGDRRAAACRPPLHSTEQVAIEEQLAAFKESLSDNSPKHVKLTMWRIHRVVTGCEFKKLADFGFFLCRQRNHACGYAGFRSTKDNGASFSERARLVARSQL